jgi:hypothetical protein
MGISWKVGDEVGFFEGAEQTHELRQRTPERPKSNPTPQ